MTARTVQRSCGHAPSASPLFVRCRSRRTRRASSWSFRDPKGLSHAGQDGGIRAWGLAAELRLHNQGRHRIEFGIGAGFGQLITLQQANGDAMGYQGHLAPYVEGALGYHFVSGHLRLGIDATIDAFNRVDMEGDFGVRFCAGTACPLGRTSYLLGLAFSIGGASIPLE